jgi:hypothetical protein
VTFAPLNVVRTFLYDPDKPTTIGDSHVIANGDPIEGPREQPGRVDLLRTLVYDTHGNLIESHDNRQIERNQKPIDEPIGPIIKKPLFDCRRRPIEYFDARRIRINRFTWQAAAWCRRTGSLRGRRTVARAVRRP